MSDFYLPNPVMPPENRPTMPMLDGMAPTTTTTTMTTTSDATRWCVIKWFEESERKHKLKVIDMNKFMASNCSHVQVNKSYIIINNGKMLKCEILLVDDSLEKCNEFIRTHSHHLINDNNNKENSRERMSKRLDELASKQELLERQVNQLKADNMQLRQLNRDCNLKWEREMRVLREEMMRGATTTTSMNSKREAAAIDLVDLSIFNAYPGVQFDMRDRNTITGLIREKKSSTIVFRYMCRGAIKDPEVWANSSGAAMRNNYPVIECCVAFVSKYYDDFNQRLVTKTLRELCTHARINKIKRCPMDFKVMPSLATQPPPPQQPTTSSNIISSSSSNKRALQTSQSEPADLFDSTHISVNDGGDASSMPPLLKRSKTDENISYLDDDHETINFQGSQ